MKSTIGVATSCDVVRGSATPRQELLLVGLYFASAAQPEEVLVKDAPKLGQLVVDLVTTSSSLVTDEVVPLTMT